MSELSRDARALLDAAAGADEPTDADRDRIGRALALSLGAGAGLGASSTAAASAAGAAASLGSAGTGAVGTGVLGGAVGIKGALTTASVVFSLAVFGGTWVEPPEGEDTEPAHETERAPPPPARTAYAMEWVLDVDAPAPPLAEPAEEQVAPAPARARAVRGEATPEETPSSERDEPPRLSVELTLLARAQRALARGEPKAALVALDEHARRFPTANLGLERDAARVIALCALGRAQGVALRDRFLEAHPRTPLAARVRTACD